MFAPRRNPQAKYYCAFDSLLDDEGERPGIERLGVSYSDLKLPTTSISIYKTRHLGLTVINNRKGFGVVIAKLAEDSVLLAAGLRCGDIISHINHTAISTHQDAIALVNRQHVGDELNFTLLPASPYNSVVLRGESSGSFGVTLEGEHANGGVTVKSLRTVGPAAAAGLQPGDEIIAISGDVPANHVEAAELLRSLKSSAAEGLQLLVRPARVYKAPPAMVRMSSRGG